MGDNELGIFLRSRRESLAPADAGLPAGARRRTPGLRRSEVAALAGVSVEYVTRLEQGRDRHPSPQVLSALAAALRLTTSERVHLHRLTKAADGGFVCTGHDASPDVVRPTVLALLRQLEPAPAAVLGRLGDVLARTTAFDRLVGPLGLLDRTPPNLLRFVFSDPRAREAFPDWDAVADQQVAALKQGPYHVHPAAAPLLAELTVTAGAAFAGRLETVPGLPRASGVLRLAHPAAGELRLAYETLDLPADDDQRLLAYLPADDATAAALDRLAAPGGLRVVAGRAG